MKIVLDLKHSYNNYEWENKEDLKDFIDNILKSDLWELYNSNLLDTDLQDRLYDILDMFNKYEIIESECEENE